MRDYDELVKALKICGGHNGCDGCPLRGDFPANDCAFAVCRDAADAIEELLAHACPHYHWNVHDRGDDSYCDVLNTEPPKEDAE